MEIAKHRWHEHAGGVLFLSLPEKRKFASCEGN